MKDNREQLKAHAAAGIPIVKCKVSIYIPKLRMS